MRTPRKPHQHECNVKNAARQHYCNLDKGHDGWHVDYEDRASWPTDEASTLAAS